MAQDSSSCSTSSPPKSPAVDPPRVAGSRLNAHAPEFVPAAARPDPAAVIRPRVVMAAPPPPPPAPPTMLHIFPSPPPPPPPPFHMAVPPHVPPHLLPVHPRSVPVQYPRPHPQSVQYYSAGFREHDATPLKVQGEPDQVTSAAASNDGLPEETVQKILNQVEYYFSDLNLATTDHLMRFINRDPEGYVPISVVASFKKIKALVSSHSQLATVLRKSSKLIVSDDGKKIRRLHPLTESDMEELQSRVVIAENLPEDHCFQNLMKIFSAVGSVKTIRTCQPQIPNGGCSSALRLAKGDNMLVSIKLHAFVEYESVELAEKAVAELNDEGNWRSGLRVRLMLRRLSKPTYSRSRKVHDGDVHSEEEDVSTSEQQSNDKLSEDSPEPSDALSDEHPGEELAVEREAGQRKGQGRGRGRGKGRGRIQLYNNNRGNQVATSPSNNLVVSDQATSGKQPPGPRMPDGTRGFSLGRGKAVVVNTA